MDIYGHDFLKPVRDVVEETQNCEDVSNHLSSSTQQLVPNGFIH